MRRAFVFLTVLTLIFSLSCVLSISQEVEKKEGEVEGKKVEEKREIKIIKEIPVPDRPPMPEERPPVLQLREMPFERLFAELERQRREIQALREEIAELREMLKNLFAPRRFWRGWEYIPPKRLEPERRQLRERWEPRKPDIERAPDIELEIGRLEDQIRRMPEDVELRMKLADVYRKAGRIEAAIDQYKIILDIKPDFDPAYRALEELKPMPEEEKGEFSIGEVISSNEGEVILKTLEGDTVTFKVPRWQKDDGSWVLDEQIAKMAKSLDIGKRVKIRWSEVEGERVIRHIEMEKE